MSDTAFVQPGHVLVRIFICNWLIDTVTSYSSLSALTQARIQGPLELALTS